LKDILVSVITVSLNSSATIRDAIQSVLNQSYHHIEYIVIDGGSTDGTVDIVNSFGEKISKFTSGHDSGIYDAINKGIRLATGNVVGILNSDDFFFNNDVISTIVANFDNDNIDAIYGDAQFVNKKEITKIERYYSSKQFTPGMFKFGIMPAHPSFYVRRELFEKYGYYRTDYKIAADYELMIRFFYINKIRYKYIEMPFISMRTGGISNKSVKSRIILNMEVARACRENGIKTNYLLIFSKYFKKIFEFLNLN